MGTNEGFAPERLQEQLLQEAKELQIELSEEQACLLIEHLSWVLQTNKTMNLTRITEPVAAVTLHIVDSLLFTKAVRGGTFIDIGTGAGYPGVPFAATTRSSGVLLDATQKKITALNEFIGKTELAGQVQGVAARAETYAVNHLNEFDAVLARAVAPVSVLLEYAAPLLKQTGLACFSKGLLTKEELTEGLRAAELCGMSCVSRETRELPHQRGTRELLTFVKKTEAKVELPRRVGAAAKHPLGRE